MGRVAAGHELHDLGREDLATVGERAEPRGFDDAVAVVVAFVLGRLAGGDPDAHWQWCVLAAAVVPVDCLLHGHRACECATQAGEDHHHAVAEALHLDATRALDRRAQQPEMRQAERLGGIRA